MEENLKFGEAVEALKQGKKLARKGWNGQNMFAFYVPENSYVAVTDIMKEHFAFGKVPYRAYLALKTAQNDVAVWNPSTSDILSEDWFIIP